ncbi:CRISPR-associated protein, Cas1 family [Stanieria cyanosphaera PCC 7437]|uniref:CRISPR-associated endonuclease Cas1 n=1 Tax=Stanieria cyanosphaera (strain ATCC 29371 / PCC 7437) TaxID=111780 RepID=K9XPV5_STAC7|nr:CRISPR-associated endonuclease Cas1 [Stanieria cyanosphaera]AFZ34066.1 CRISPR-associated protein, Cas1 family [Stanieria cyanosphaera PCC 7437]
MKTLYISQQGCYLSLKKETLIVERQRQILTEVQIPLVEQILIFGKSQITTQAIRACIWQNIPIVYLSRMGYCYGRLLPLEKGYRQLTRYQQQLSHGERLAVAREIVISKLKNSRVLLQRQQRKRDLIRLSQAIASLDYLVTKAKNANNTEQLLGYEGAGAASYFSALGEVITNRDFVFVARCRRPPGNPVNALFSFGYQVLWNHLLALIELQGLDPYQACLHQGTERHAALASDLIEEFRAPIVDSLVLYLVNRRVMNVEEDFTYHQGGCYLNDSGRKKYLKAFVQRMEEKLQTDAEEKQPRWDLLTQQVKLFKQFVYQPTQLYRPYLIR